MPVIGGLLRFLVVPILRPSLVGFLGQPVSRKERGLTVELLGMVEHERCPAHHRANLPHHALVLTLSDTSEVMGHGHINGPVLHGTVECGQFVTLERLAQIVLGPDDFLRSLGQCSACFGEPPLSAHLREGHQRGLRQVDHGRSWRQAHVEQEAEGSQRRGNRAALRVHQDFVALDHLIHNLLALDGVVFLDAFKGFHVFLHSSQLVLQAVGVAQFGEVAGAVKSVLSKGPACVLAETWRSLAVNAVLGPRQIRQARQVQLRNRIPKFVVHALFVQGVHQVGHEALANSITTSVEFGLLQHFSNRVSHVRRESLLQFLAGLLGFLDGFRTSDVLHFAVGVLDHDHVLAEAGQREVHAL